MQAAAFSSGPGSILPVDHQARRLFSAIVEPDRQDHRHAEDDRGRRQRAPLHGVARPAQRSAIAGKDPQEDPYGREKAGLHSESSRISASVARSKEKCRF